MARPTTRSSSVQTFSQGSTSWYWALPEASACASSDEKLAICKAAGADWLINYTNEELKTALLEKTGRKNVDVVLDPVGGDFSETAFRLMAPCGRHLVVGFVAGDIPRIPLNLPLLKEAAIVGVFWNSFLVGSTLCTYRI